MLPHDEYKALKEAYLARQNRPPIPEPVNYYKLSANDSSYQVPSSTWTNSTASEVGSFRTLTNTKKRPSKGRSTRCEPRANSHPLGFSTSSPNESTAGPNGPTYPNTEPRFGDPDPVAYKTVQALHGSSYRAGLQLLDASPSIRQSTKPPPVRHAQGRSSTDSGIMAWARRQPHSELFHNSEDAEDAEPNRSSTIDRLAFAEATQGISHDPSMPMNLGPEHAQYWASRQSAMGKVGVQNRRSERPLSNEPQLATKQVHPSQDPLPGRDYHRMNPSEAFFTPGRTKHQKRHSPVYEGLFDRPKPTTPPRKKKGLFKRIWKKIF